MLHAHVPSFVSALRCMALLSVIWLALSQHHTALLLIYLSIVGLSITSPGSRVPQHRWSQHHISRLALMLTLMCLAVAIHSLSHIHGLSGQIAIHGLRKTIHGWSRSMVCAEHIQAITRGCHKYMRARRVRECERASLRTRGEPQARPRSTSLFAGLRVLLRVPARTQDSPEGTLVSRARPHPRERVW